MNYTAPPKPRSFGKKDINKRWRKTFWLYVKCGFALTIIVGLLSYAEWEISLDREWMVTYDRRCEACQAMVVSGVFTRSVLFQQEKKRIQDERELALKINPEAVKLPMEEPKIPATAVVKRMCRNQQIEVLLSNHNFVFENGYAVSDDPDFASNLMKMCGFAMSNSTMTQVFQRMLEVPIQSVADPTLVSLSREHFNPVCVVDSGMCTAEELEHGGMVDPQNDKSTTPRNLEEED